MDERVMFVHEFLFLIFLLSCFDVSKGFKCMQRDVRKNCVKREVCNRSYTLIRLQPYPYSILRTEWQLERCCGDCVKVNKTNFFHASISDLHDDIMKNADIIYPVIGRNKLDSYDSRFHFFPIIEHSGFTYVTKIELSSFELAIKSCLNMYPLFVICVMMSIVFGFVVWVVGTLRSKEDYPRCFPIGWLKGMWWSMATMISTGPESTPKSFIGRILALFWLIVAVIMVSLMSSIITAAMVKPLPTPSMNGARVGVVGSDIYTWMEIFRRNGKGKKYPGSSFEDELSNALTALHQNKLDGVLVDKYRLKIFWSSQFIKKNKAKNHIEHADYPYVLTDIKSDESLAYGALVALDEKNKEFFHALFANEAIFSKAYLLLYIAGSGTRFEINIREKVKSKSGPLVFMKNGPYIKTTMMWLAVIIGILLVIGTMYELVRRKAPCFASSKEIEEKQEESCLSS